MIVLWDASALAKRYTKVGARSYMREVEALMAAANETSWRRLVADKQAIRDAVAQVNADMGFVPDPTATPQKVRELMRALGIRAEDNIFSCGVIAARDEE